MSSIPALKVAAQSSMLRVFRSWLKDRSGEILESSEAQAAEADSCSTHCYGSVDLLVVDDNPVNLMLVSALMELRGLVPVLAADGAEAVALACERPFDLILMDLQMPILNGFEATSAIRRFEKQRSRPAVPVVAYASTIPSARVLAAHGISGSLDKPCGDQDLDNCLVRWCPGYRPAPALRGAVQGKGRWQPTGSAFVPGSTSLR